MTTAPIYEYPMPNGLSMAHKWGARYYFTGRPCKRGHVDKRYAKNGTCYSCMKEDLKSQSKREDFKVKARKRNQRYTERLKAQDPDGFRDRVAQKAREWFWRNRQLVYKRAKSPERRAKSLEATVRRQYRTKRATPAWANLLEIKRTYAQSALASVSSGVPHQVDHYVPIAGNNVCGLHCHENLRVVPYWENIEKGNRWA